MQFYIQAGSPRSTETFDETDINLSEAIESVFPLYTENGIIVWNGVYIPLSYKYDISVMIIDIINMLSTLKANEEGDMQISWSSDSFDAVWNLRWNLSEIVISSEWNNVLGDVVDILKTKPVVKLEKEHFFSEWKMMLKIVKDELSKAGYTDSKLPDIHMLKDILMRLERFGILYS